MLKGFLAGCLMSAAVVVSPALLTSAQAQDMGGRMMHREHEMRRDHMMNRRMMRRDMMRHRMHRRMMRDGM